MNDLQNAPTNNGLRKAARATTLCTVRTQLGASAKKSNALAAGQEVLMLIVNSESGRETMDLVES